MTIGVYDSGIGGLNTLAAIKRALPGHDYYYFSDNGNMPFGTKDRFELYKTVKSGLNRLQNNSDVQVIACNTASTMLHTDDAFLLRPALEGLRPESTLLLATPHTISAVKANEKFFNTANTPELASLIEIVASLSFKRKQELTFAQLANYIGRKLSHFKDISTVVLGCTHFTYVQRYIRLQFSSARLIDGNEQLANELKSKLPTGRSSEKIKFEFSGINESEKYLWLLKQIEDNPLYFSILNS